jgi:hypothetical protein
MPGLSACLSKRWPCGSNETSTTLEHSAHALPAAASYDADPLTPLAASLSIYTSPTTADPDVSPLSSIGLVAWGARSLSTFEGIWSD